MNIFDILGPIMVGPSSSHTAGAVRIGLVARKLLGEKPVFMEMCLHGSFADTGEGHGTDKALVAGMLLMNTDDERIPHSFDIAKQENLQVRKCVVNLKDAHPNTVLLKVCGENGTKLELVASSLGGGRIKVYELDGMKVEFTGNYPTLIIRNLDKPGPVAHVTARLLENKVNIANMQLYRDSKGGYAAMVIESDDKISKDIIDDLQKMESLVKISYLE